MTKMNHEKLNRNSKVKRKAWTSGKKEIDDPFTPITIISKFDTKCFVCNGLIGKDKKIKYFPFFKKAVHKNCRSIQETDFKSSWANRS